MGVVMVSAAMWSADESLAGREETVSMIWSVVVLVVAMGDIVDDQ